jgi:hypothetical protein
VFMENFDNAGTIIVNRSNLRLLHGLFGPKLALGHSNVHPFVTSKGGFLDAMISTRHQPLLGLFSALSRIFVIRPSWVQSTRVADSKGTSAASVCVST